MEESKARTRICEREDKHVVVSSHEHCVVFGVTALSSSNTFTNGAVKAVMQRSVVAWVCLHGRAKVEGVNISLNSPRMKWYSMCREVIESTAPRRLA